MITIKRYFNVKTVKIRADVIENIGVLQANGSFNYVSYIDSIEYQKVNFLNNPKKVLLEAHGYKLTDSISEPWIDLKEDQYLIGAQTHNGVFLVTKHGEPMIGNASEVSKRG